MLPIGPVEIVLTFVVAYGVTGGVVAVAFLLFGIERVSQGAIGAHAFRPLLLPGLLLLWPLVVTRWAASHTRRGS